MPDIPPEDGRVTASGDAIRAEVPEVAFGVQHEPSRGAADATDASSESQDSDVDGAREHPCCAGENGGLVPAANELLHHVAGGDSKAYAELYRLLAPHVYGLCLRIIRDAHLAEDAAQEALLDVWHHAPRFDPARAHAHTWAMTITHHRAVDLVRTVRAQTVREQRASSASWTPPPDLVPEAVLRASEHQDLRRALNALTQRQRLIIDFVYYRGHTMAEAASLLGQSVGSVKFTAHAARRRLRDTLCAQG